MTVKKAAKKAGYGVFLTAVFLIMIIPIYYLLVTTFKTPAEAAESPLGLPRHFTFENYSRAIEAMGYGQALKNNLIIAVVSVVLLIVFASMSAYVIARSRKKLFQIMNSIFMVGLIIPFQISIIPLYRMLAAAEYAHSGYFGGCFLYQSAAFCFSDEGLYSYGS